MILRWMSQLETFSKRHYAFHMNALQNWTSQLEWVEANFTEIRAADDVFLDLRYATTNNFMGENLYGGFNRCFLHPEAYEQFERARSRLRSERPDLQFVIWDALRPRLVQKKMFDRLRGTEFENYVAPPDPGSMHSFGMALDLTLRLRSGESLDMGTDFDDFHELAQPKYEEHFRAQGLLSEASLQNRLLLRRLMHEQGFEVLPHEWWHFNARPSREVMGRYPLLK